MSLHETLDFLVAFAPRLTKEDRSPCDSHWRAPEAYTAAASYRGQRWAAWTTRLPQLDRGGHGEIVRSPDG